MRKSVKVYPDSRRVIARFFFNGDKRGKEVVSKVMTLSDEQVFNIISPLLQEYSQRHRNITKILRRHCKKLMVMLADMNIDYHDLNIHV